MYSQKRKPFFKPAIDTGKESFKEKILKEIEKRNRFDGLIFKFTHLDEISVANCGCVSKKVFLFGSGKNASYRWSTPPAGMCRKHKKELKELREKQQSDTEERRIESLKKAREEKKKKRLKEKEEEKRLNKNGIR